MTFHLYSASVERISICVRNNSGELQTDDFIPYKEHRISSKESFCADKNTPTSGQKVSFWLACILCISKLIKMMKFIFMFF